MAFWKWQRKNWIPVAPLTGRMQLIATIPWEWKLLPWEGTFSIEVGELLNGWLVAQTVFNSQASLIAIMRIDYRIINPVLTSQFSMLCSKVSYGGVDMYGPILDSKCTMHCDAIHVVDERIEIGGNWGIAVVMTLDGSLVLLPALADYLKGEVELQQVMTGDLTGNVAILSNILDRDVLGGSFRIWSDLQGPAVPSSGYHFDRNHTR